MRPIAEIKTEVDRLAALIGAEEQSLPTYGHTEDLARPHVEVDSRGYHLVVVERGKELSRFTTPDFDALLYQIFRNVTFTIASGYELEHRIEAQDHRRIVFPRQIELLSRLSESWCRSEAQEHNQILRQHPFDDQSTARAQLAARVGWSKACEQYPLPKAPDSKCPLNQHEWEFFDNFPGHEIFKCRNCTTKKFVELKTGKATYE